MTRKDYELIAAALKRARDGLPKTLANSGLRHEGLLAGINALGHALANENPRFDRDRFNAACGIGSGE